MFKTPVPIRLAIVVLCVACVTSRGTPPTPDLAITTDAAAYDVTTSASKGTNIIFAYTNRTGSTVSTGYCHAPPPPTLQRLVEGEWVYAFKPAENLCYSGQFRIPSDSVYRGVLSLRSNDLSKATSIAAKSDSTPGIYRLYFSFLRTDDIGKTQPHRVEAISSSFRITLR
jgi:hypothetical protein